MAAEVISTGTCRIAVVRMDNPPLNAVSLGLIRRILTDLSSIETAMDVDAVVLSGAPGIFATSLPIREIETHAEGATALRDLCARIEDFPKPVVAALAGHVAGAGMDIALAAHARVAEARARLGFPDLHIGLCPSGGATQRLPRLIGADRALAFLIGAVPHPAEAPVCRGLVDRLVRDGTVMDAALALAEEVADNGLWGRTRDRTDGFGDMAAYRAAIADWRARPGAERMAERGMIDAVEAAPMLTFDAGCAKEAAIWEDLHQTPRSRGLRRARFSEQRARRLTARTSDVPVSFAAYPVSTAAGRIVGAAALAGAQSLLVDAHADQAIQVLGDVRYRLTRQAELRDLSVTQGQAIADRVRASGNLSDLAQASVILVSPGAGGAPGLARRLAEVAPYVSDRAVVLCLTGEEDCEWLAPPSLAGRVMGLSIADMDFPARLAEVKVSDGTSLRALALAQAALRVLGRVMVRTPAGLPSLTNRMLDALMAGADMLAALGVPPAQIDKALISHGVARGAYGLLRQVNATAYLARADQAGRAQRLSARMLREGIAPPVGGQSNAMLDGLAAGLRPGPVWSPGEAVIRTAITLALVNAGCELIAAGAAERPMQVDVAMIQGWGYPRETGGPMAEADQMGLPALVEFAGRLSTRAGAKAQAVWAPHRILVDLAADQGRFVDIDTGGRSRVAAEAAQAG